MPHNLSSECIKCLHYYPIKIENVEVKVKCSLTWLDIIVDGKIKCPYEDD